MKIKFAHWSDSHGDNVSITNTQKLLNTIPELDFTMHTGDAVFHYFQENPGVDFNKTLFTIGNHEALDYSGVDGWTNDDWSKQPTEKELYDKFFKPYIINSNITISTNKTYWYKLFKNKFMVIGVNDCMLEDMYNEQETWLRALLETCLTNNYHVIIGSHYTPLTPPVECNFTAKRYYFDGINYPNIPPVNNLYTWIPVFRNMCNEFINRGLRIVCYLHGHEHADGFFIDNGVPEFAVGSTKNDKYNDVSRSILNRTNSVVLNLYEYDTYTECITCFRLGADTCKTGDIRKMICYSLDKKSIVAQCGA